MGTAAKFRGFFYSHFARLLDRTPLRRFGRDTEVASLVAYLAAGFITGGSLTVDGGYIA
jgi:NAD(P)-dependent dehydrogenase (short-subunit alcohol dehydrogenase family)